MTPLVTCRSLLGAYGTPGNVEMGACFKPAVCRVWGWQELRGLTSGVLPEVSPPVYENCSYCSWTQMTAGVGAPKRGDAGLRPPSSAPGDFSQGLRSSQQLRGERVRLRKPRADRGMVRLPPHQMSRRLATCPVLPAVSLGPPCGDPCQIVPAHRAAAALFIRL